MTLLKTGFTARFPAARSLLARTPGPLLLGGRVGIRLAGVAERRGLVILG